MIFFLNWVQMTLNWKKIERTEHGFPSCLNVNDDCWYAREYIAGGSYQDSETNSLIHNFKKDHEKRCKQEWYYKGEAIKKFAQELNYLDFTDNTVIFIPPSYAHDAAEYDDRFEQTLDLLKKTCPNINIQKPIVRTINKEPSHLGGPRDYQSIRQGLKWNGFTHLTSTVVIIDDLITSGSHFTVCRDMIKEKYPEVPIGGVFWAKRIEKVIEIPDDDTYGECICGARAMFDAYCEKCWHCIFYCEDGEIHDIDDSGHISSVLADGSDREEQCPNCGNNTFRIEYHEYCSYHNHTFSKDD